MPKRYLLHTVRCVNIRLRIHEINVFMIIHLDKLTKITVYY